MTLSWRWELFTRLCYFLPLFPFPFAGVAFVVGGATAVLKPVTVDSALAEGTGSVLAESGFPPR